MCGIFGAIGKGFDKSIIRGLAIANRDRGTDSLGFVINDYKIWKQADDPLNCMLSDDFNEYTKMWDYSWFIIGHTRSATRGNIIRKNAHPFRRGRFVGVHNGVINAPVKCTVDSMYLWDQLKRWRGDYQTAWKDIWGNWGLAWYDGKHVYLQAHCQTLATAEVDGITYFSSDFRHLSAVTGQSVFWDFTEGETWRYLMNGSSVECNPFIENPRPQSNFIVYTGKDTQKEKKDYNKNEDWRYLEEKAWDREAWDEYTKEYESDDYYKKGGYHVT